MPLHAKSFHAPVKRPDFLAVTPHRSSLTEIDRAWAGGVSPPTWRVASILIAPPRSLNVQDDLFRPSRFYPSHSLAMTSSLCSLIPRHVAGQSLSTVMFH